MGTAGAAGDSAAPTVPFVGAAAVLKPEHTSVGAAPMSTAPKKSPVATNCFSYTVCPKTSCYLSSKA